MWRYPTLRSMQHPALHAVVASEKGVVVGRLQFDEDGDPIDCQRMGIGGKAIPPNTDKVALVLRYAACTCAAPASCPAGKRMPQRQQGLLRSCSQVTRIQSDALFILLVEKDAAFMRLAEDRFYNTYPCIILTAKGQPDVATRCARCLCCQPPTQ